MGFRLANSVLWYVVEILIVCILFYAVNRLKINHNAWFVIYALFMIGALVGDIGTWWYISTFCFLIGLHWNNIKFFNEIVCKNLYWYIICIFYITLYVAIKLIIPYANLGFFSVYKNIISVGLSIAAIPLFIFVIAGISQRCVILNRLKVVGQISYEIYLYHMLIAEIIWKFSEDHGKTFCHVIAIVMGTIFLAYTINKIKIKNSNS